MGVQGSYSVERCPSVPAAAKLLASAGLPASDLSDGAMEHFFYCGEASEPIGLVGLEPIGEVALLRSLVVSQHQRASGMGSRLVERAEAHARSHGVRSVYLLTNTAERFFAHRGYMRVSRESAPPEIRSTRELASLCPASSALMVKHL